MATVKGFKIDVEKQSITPVTLENYKYDDIYPHIGNDCRCFACVNIEKDDVIYVDDEGLMKSQIGFFLYKGYNQPLAGNGFVLGTDSEGETVDAKITLEQLEKRVHFMTHFQVAVWAAANPGA